MQRHALFRPVDHLVRPDTVGACVPPASAVVTIRKIGVFTMEEPEVGDGIARRVGDSPVETVVCVRVRVGRPLRDLHGPAAQTPGRSDHVAAQRIGGG